jgi:hypothetical protein
MHLNMRLGTFFTTAALFSQSAVAHYKFPSLIVDGTPTPEFKYVRFNTNNINPLLDLTSIDLRCNEGGLASGPQTETAVVQAGSKVPRIYTTPFYHPYASANYPIGRIHSQQRHRSHRSLAGIYGQSTRGPLKLRCCRRGLVQDPRMGRRFHLWINQLASAW